MTVVAFYSSVDAPEPWREALAAADPGIELRCWPDWGDRAGIRYALAWRPPPGLLAELPALEVVFSLGAGVDHLFGAGVLPEGVTVVRMVDPELTRGMSEFIVLNVLWHHRRMPRYVEQQQRECWQELPQVPAAARRVGVMGAGELGRAALGALAPFGFQLASWSRTRKRQAGVRSCAGMDELRDFLACCDILVLLLPSTDATRRMLNRERLAWLPRGAALVNAGRGDLVVEDDLLALLDSGHIEAASLDVFEREPLAAGHPLWRHPRVLVTPHVASVTLPASAATAIADGIRRHGAGEPLRHVVMTERGY